MRVRSFDMIVCIDFLLKLTTFLTVPSDSHDPIPVHKKNMALNTVKDSIRPSSNPVTQVAITKTESKMNLILHIEKPDIILVESLDDLNTKAIVFNVSIVIHFLLFSWICCFTILFLLITRHKRI